MNRREIAKLIDEASHADIAKRTGLSPSGVSRILNGGRDPKSKNLEKVATYFNITIDELYQYLKHLREKRRRNQTAAA